MSAQLAVIEVFNNEFEAEIARERLKASGIDAFVSKDDLGGMRPELQLTRGVRLLVSESDVEIAKELLQSDVPDKDRESVIGESWTCRGCGEIIEGQFTECWQCGTSRFPES